MLELDTKEEKKEAMQPRPYLFWEVGKAPNPNAFRGYTEPEYIKTGALRLTNPTSSRTAQEISEVSSSASGLHEAINK